MSKNIDHQFYDAMRPIGGIGPAEIDVAAGQAANADIVSRGKRHIRSQTIDERRTERNGYIEKASAIYNEWVGRSAKRPNFTQKV